MENEKDEINENDSFSYDNLNKLFCKEHNFKENGRPKLGYGIFNVDGNYKAVRSGAYKGFISLEKSWNIEFDGVKPKGKFYRTGLKFHVSLPEDDYKVNDLLPKDQRDYYKQGWKIVQETLLANNVRKFKVADEGERMSESVTEDENEVKQIGRQRGKDITIFTEQNPEYDIHDWIGILQEITQELARSNIPPGYRPCQEGSRAENILKGNNYISYRYEFSKPEKDLFADDEVIETFNWPEQPDNLKWPFDKNDAIIEIYDERNENNDNNNENKNCCRCIIL